MVKIISQHVPVPMQKAKLHVKSAFIIGSENWCLCEFEDSPMKSVTSKCAQCMSNFPYILRFLHLIGVTKVET